MARLLMDGMEYMAREYGREFCNSPDAKCAFIARSEKRIENQAGKFAAAVQRKTGAHLITIDMAQKAAEGKSPLTAVYEELCLLAQKEGIEIPDDQSRSDAAKILSRRLCVAPAEGTVPVPIIYFKHFQCCKLTVSVQGISEYAFLRELPCRLVISSNMEIIETEKTFIPIGIASLLAPLVDQITVERDVPYRSNEVSKACSDI